MLALELALLLLPALGPDRAQDLRAAVEALASPTAAGRALGERWIASHARPEDFPVLADAAAAGGTDLRVRLSRAIGADDGHLGLAMLFATDDAEALARLGASAVHEIASRWNEGLGVPLVADHPIDGTLRRALERARESWPVERCRLRVDGSPEELADRVARLGNLPVPLCVDPSVAVESRPPAPAGAGAELEGSWDRLLSRLGVALGVSLEGALVEDAKGELVPVFLCFRPQRAPRLLPANELLLEWCRLSLEGGPGAVRAARALAGTGWPAAIAWFEARAREPGDAAAREGVLLAAGRGWIVPTLLRSPAVRALLETADAELAAGDEASLLRADRIVRALRQLPPVALDGVRLDELLVDGWDGLGGLARRFRLIALERMGSTSPTVRDAVGSVLRGDSVSPELRLQALRTWCGLTRPGPLELARPLALLRSTGGEPAAHELAALLLQSGARPPEVGSDPVAVDELSLEGRAALLEWRLGVGQPVQARAELIRLCRFEDGWPDRLRSWTAWRGQELAGAVLARFVARGEGPRIARWLESAREALEPGEAHAVLHRVAVLAGAPVPDVTARDLGLLRRIVPPDGEPGIDGDEAVLGVLAGRPLAVVADRARPALLGRLGSVLGGGASDDAIVVTLDGVERCIRSLLAAGEDYRALVIADEARDAVQGFAASPRGRRLVPPDWPVGPNDTVDLDRRERSVATAPSDRGR